MQPQHFHLPFAINYDSHPCRHHIFSSFCPSVTATERRLHLPMNHIPGTIEKIDIASEQGTKLLCLRWRGVQYSCCSFKETATIISRNPTMDLILFSSVAGFGVSLQGIQPLHASSYMTLVLQRSGDLRKKKASLWSPADGPCNARHDMQEYRTVWLPLCVRGAATRDGALRVLGHVAQVRGVSRDRERESVGEG